MTLPVAASLRRPLLSALVLAVFAVLLAPAPAAQATTYVLVSDEYLVESSAAAVRARVLSVDSAPGTTLPSTDYLIEVDEVLAGDVTGRNLVVRIPGGVREDGVGLALYGMPELVLGERVMLFLSPSRHPQAAGTWAVSHLALGAFHEILHDGQRLLVRDLGGARELALPGAGSTTRQRFHRARRADAFARWVEARGRGSEPVADYLYEAPAGGAGADSVSAQFRLFRGSNDRKIRWFEFDRAEPVEWRVNSGGQPGFSLSDTIRAFRGGLAPWTGDGGSNVDYRYAGTTGSSFGQTNNDGVNAVVFANPDESISGGDFSCGDGGTLAVGGPFFRGIAPGPGGESYNIALEGFIVTNRGIECFLNGQPDPVRALEQLLGHELGHTLGIQHPCTTDEADAGQCPVLQSDALMYPYLHTDGRGAVLNSDDRAAVRSLYPAASTPPPSVPAAPTDLEVEVVTPTRVRLTWIDQADDENGYVVQEKEGSGEFEDLSILPANSEEHVVAGLDRDQTYVYQVLARGSSGRSAASNAVTLAPVPPPPTEVVANPLSMTSVGVTWDSAAGAEDYEVEIRSPGTGAWELVAEGVEDVPGESVSTVIGGLASGTPYSFRVRSSNPRGRSAASEVAAATPSATDPGTCVETDGAICLLGERFRVSVEWRNQFADDDFGIGHGESFPDSDRTGTFWFFNSDNTELIVKMLDGTGVNDFYWTFYGALTNVEYWVTVVDTTDGASRTYYNPPGNECGQADTASIPGDDVPIEDSTAIAGAVSLPWSTAAASSHETGTCVADATTLCLLDDRFAVTVDWATSQGTSGDGTAVGDEDSERTGYFWFFNPSNIELVVKALDGRPVNGNFWFFYGALSNVEYTITVTDTVADETRTYENLQDNYCGQLDTDAFIPDGP